jgi:acyl carrier protein
MTEIATDRQKIVGVILECLGNLPLRAGASLTRTDEDLPLLGADSPLDSMGLVMLIVDVEQKINDQYHADLILANERAMSRRHSPFRTVGAFAEYIVELLQETGTR